MSENKRKTFLEKSYVKIRDVRDRDQKKKFTGTRTGTEKKLPGPTLESEAI